MLDRIKLAYPTPIATAYAAAMSARESHERTKRLRELFEIAVRYAVLASCARAFTSGSAGAGTPRLAPLRGNHISLGTWVHLLGELDGLLKASGETALGTELDQRRGDLERCNALLRLVDPAFDSKRLTLRDTLYRLTGVRNQDAHLGAFDLPRRVREYELAIEELLEAIPLFREWDVVFVDAIEVKRSGTKASFLAYRGDGSPAREDAELTTRDGIFEDTLYLRRPADGCFVELFPFLIAEGRRLFFFDGIGSNRAPRYALNTPEPSSEQIAEAERGLRERAAFLFAEPSIELDTALLAALVEATAIDGYISPVEQAFLKQRVRSLEPRLDEAAVERAVSLAISQYAAGAIVEGATSPGAAPTLVQETYAPVVELAVPSSVDLPTGGEPVQAATRVNAEEVALSAIQKSEAPLTRSKIATLAGIDQEICRTALRRLMATSQIAKIGSRGPAVRYALPEAAVLTVLRESTEPLRASEIRSRTDLEAYRWQRLINDLLTQRVVVAEGAGRGRTYRLASAGIGEPNAAKEASACSQPAALVADDWQDAVLECLRRVRARVDTISLPFNATSRTDDPEFGDVVAGWAVIQWAFTSAQFFFVAIGRKYADKVSITWGYASEHSRRDPLFRRVCRELGCVRPGDEVEIGEQSYVFSPQDDLSLAAEERVTLTELGNDNLIERAARGVASAAEHVVPLIQQQIASPQLEQQDAGETTPSWEKLSEAFLKKVDAGVVLPFEPAWRTDSEDIGTVEDGWAQVSWALSPSHTFFVALGKKWGWKVSVVVGFISDYAKRDPWFRRVCRELELRESGDELTLGDRTYIFCPEENLSLECEDRLNIVDLSDPELVSPTLGAVSELIAAILTAANRVSSEPLESAPAHDAPAAGTDASAPSPQHVGGASIPGSGVDADWRQKCQVFLRRLVERLGTNPGEFPFCESPNSLESTGWEGPWLYARWRINASHYCFVSTGAKRASRVSIGWGIGSYFARRDPAFRALARDWGCADGTALPVGGDRFRFYSEGELLISTYRRVEITALHDDGLTAAIATSFEEFVRWVAERLPSPGPSPVGNGDLSSDAGMA